MRRVVCIIVLFSMMLHCITRLGVTSYLYSKRHQVALSVGLIDEVPITLCKSDYPPGTPLVIAAMQDQNVPVPFTHTSEIHLFVESATPDIAQNQAMSTLTHQTMMRHSEYTPPALTVFHPPC